MKKRKHLQLLSAKIIRHDFDSPSIRSTTNSHRRPPGFLEKDGFSYPGHFDHSRSGCLSLAVGSNAGTCISQTAATAFATSSSPPSPSLPLTGNGPGNRVQD